MSRASDGDSPETFIGLTTRKHLPHMDISGNHGYPWDRFYLYLEVKVGSRWEFPKGHPSRAARTSDALRGIVQPEGCRGAENMLRLDCQT